MEKLKVSKKTNLELMESVLLKIESYGYHIKDKVFGNCYFIFEGEDNSVCHFHIKEIPGFLFGLWSTCRFDTIKYQIKHNGVGHTWADSLDISPLSEIVFFTQYERDLDKFKPSRSGFVTGLFRQVWEEGPDFEHREIKEDWEDYELEAILDYMKKHPIRSAEYSGMQTRYIWHDDRSGLRIFFTWVKDWYYHWKYEFKDWLAHKINIFVSKRLVKHLKSFYYLIEDKGENWTPRLDIYIRRKENVDLENICVEQKYIDKFDDKWFNRVPLYQYDIDITDNHLTQDDYDDDKQLELKFKQLVSIKANYQNDEDNEASIISTNIKELMK